MVILITEPCKVRTMIKWACHSIAVCFAVFLLTAGGFASSAMMAPDSTEPAQTQLALMGFGVDDFCGDVGGPDHRCPFCHLTPDTPQASPLENETRLVSLIAWKRADDLHRAAQARDHARSPRAPPILL